MSAEKPCRNVLLNAKKKTTFVSHPPPPPPPPPDPCCNAVLCYQGNPHCSDTSTQKATVVLCPEIIVLDPNLTRHANQLDHFHHVLVNETIRTQTDQLDRPTSDRADAHIDPK